MKFSIKDFFSKCDQIHNVYPLNLAIVTVPFNWGLHNEARVEGFQFNVSSMHVQVNLH